VDKQTAQRLLDEMPDGTERVVTYNDSKDTAYMKMYAGHKLIHEANDSWVPHPDLSVSEHIWADSYTVEHLHWIVDKTLTRDQALQWCVDNLNEWPGHSTGLRSPDGWKWSSRNGACVLFKHGEIIIDNCSYLESLPSSTLTRDQALQWCVDNVTVWGTHDGVTPDGWEWSVMLASMIVFKGGDDFITRGEWKSATRGSDPVHQPKHYEVIEGLEAIEIIASSLTRDEWKGYCVGNILKYRLRAGKKDALQQDVDKANEYEMLFDKYKELNRK